MQYEESRTPGVPCLLKAPVKVLRKGAAARIVPSSSWVVRQPASATTHQSESPNQKRVYVHMVAKLTENSIGVSIRHLKKPLAQQNATLRLKTMSA